MARFGRPFEKVLRFPFKKFGSPGFEAEPFDISMLHRDMELLEAIRRDDLASVLTSRYEKPLDSLQIDDTPVMLRQWPSPIMIASYFGSVKCFDFFFHKANIDYLDRVLFVYFAFLLC
jgi:hypothetical protein